jgi:tetratricopeptide (TPR) repeat protein
LLTIALVKRRQGKLDESIEVQQQSAKLDPLNEDIWVNLGRSYRGKRKFDEARSMFDRALTLASSNNTPPLFVAVSHAMLGDLHAAKGDRDKAQPLFVQAEQELKSLQAGGDNSFLLTNTLVQVEAHLGHRHEVESDAASILQRIKNDAWGFGREEEAVARAYTLLGDFDRAVPLLQHALVTPAHASLTPALLRLDPFWDPVRNDPRFQKLANSRP